MRSDIDIYAVNLMKPEEEMRNDRVSEEVIGRVIRLRDVYNYMLRNPLVKDRTYVDYIESRYGVTKRTAYGDLEILHAIVGNLQQCTKEWHRWRFNNMIMEGYAIALRRQDPAAIAKLAQQYGKYNRLDKTDDLDNRLSEVPHIVFTFDVAKIGFRPIPNAFKYIDQIIKKYGGTPYEDLIEDVDFVEIADEPDKKKEDGDARSISE